MRNRDGEKKLGFGRDEETGENWIHSVSRGGIHVSGNITDGKREDWHGLTTSGINSRGPEIPSAPWFNELNKEMLDNELPTVVTLSGIMPDHRILSSDVDMVNHPPHYTSDGIECIQAIEAQLTKEEYRGYLKGNVAKYLWREKHKGGTESLKKAQWYLSQLIKLN